jgi:Putative peptidoglycan binding domain/Caspase domain
MESRPDAREKPGGMIRRRATLLFGGLALAGASIPASAGAASPHLALVIGNSAYAALPALPGCTASAHLVSAALRRAGFDVTERLDLSNGQMGGAIGELAGTLSRSPGATAVVYVCGYVAGLDGRAFLLPVSASLERDSDALTQGIVARSLPDALTRSGARAGLVLIDAQPRPGGSGPLGLDKLAEGPPAPGESLAAAVATAGLPQGPTPLATALAGALAGPTVEAGALLDAARRRLGTGSGETLAMLAPAGPAWLAGGPAPPARIETSPPPAAPPPPAPAASAPPPIVVPDEEQMTEANRRAVQGMLQALGYYDGRVDGIFGPDTRAAIRRWQHELGAEMTGRITSDQATRLLAIRR